MAERARAGSAALRVLLVHQNFPGQFGHLSRLLSARGHMVVALTMSAVRDACGARVVTTPLRNPPAPAGHRWAQDFDVKITRAAATLDRARALRTEGFVPDLIVAHPGWGDALFLKDAWPEARLALYCEFYYRAEGADLGFDPEFPPPGSMVERQVRTRLRNLPQRMLFDVADAGLSPTRFQANGYPAPMRDRIGVIHDGIDTDIVRPGPARPLRLADGRRVDPGDEIVTFVSRSLEPYRGIHSLLRAWPAIQRARPAARLVVIGRDRPGYGAAAPAGTTWKRHFLEEAGDAIDPARTLFLGGVDYPIHLNVLRLSSLHVYLTYPFVLSWSLLEAMASGCAVLGSDTAPVREFVADGATGALAPFLAPDLIAERAIALLADPATRARLGAAARGHVVESLDLRSVVQPQQLAWVDGVMAGAPLLAAPD